MNFCVLSLLCIIVRLNAFQKMNCRHYSSLSIRSLSEYRLYDSDGVKILGFLAKPVGFVLNIVGDLLRIQGSQSFNPIFEQKKKLFKILEKVQPNGLTARLEQKVEIEKIVEILATYNPTVFIKYFLLLLTIFYY
jgi:hypothetical protein